MKDHVISDRLLALLTPEEREALASGELDSIFDPAATAPMLLLEAQESLRRREQEFRALVENAPDLIVRLSHDLRFVYVNPAFERLTGLEARVVEGRLCLDLPIPETFSATFVSAVARVLATAQEEQVELDWPAGAGHHFFSVRIVPELSDNGLVDSVLAIMRDVTEHRLSAEALRNSEERYRSLFEYSMDGVILTSADGAIVGANPALCEMLGYTEREIMALGMSCFLDRDDPLLPEVLTDRHRAVRDQEQLVFRHRDGTRIPVELTTSFYTEENGAERTSMIVRDVTQRHRAEAELRVAEAHYRRLVQNAPQCIYVLASGGRFAEINPAGERLLDRPAKEILGHHVAEVVAPDHIDRVGEAFAQVISGVADNLLIEAKIVRRDREERTVLISLTAIWEGGEITGIQGVAQDVTEERAQDAQRRLLATALDRLGEGICLMTAEGECIYVNETFRRIFGIGRTSPTLIRLEDLVTSEESRASQRDALRTARERGRWSGRIQRRRLNDGQEVPLDVVLGRIDDETIGAGLLFGIIQDATIQVARDQQLRRAERLASLGTLIGGVAHELNNPLHAIRNFAELMLLEQRSGDDREGLEIIHREATRAANIVSDLRMVARQTQESERVREKTDLNELIRHVLRVRRYSHETGNVEVREELADLPEVMVSRSAIEQVLMNLFVNAEQAMATQTGPKKLVIRTRAMQRAVLLEVVDNGPGIAPEHLGRVFDPFFSTKSQGEGTGLGLALVHNIVSEHGGTIEVRNENGQGACFRMELPQDTSAAQVLPQGAPPVAPDRLRVLIIDDEESNRRLSVRFLKPLGHEVDTATDGIGALELLKHHEYDVIVTDLRMPGMGGEELFQRLRKEGEGKERRLIVVTGDISADARPLILAGIPVITKPMKLEEFAREVYAAAARGRLQGSG